MAYRLSVLAPDTPVRFGKHFEKTGIVHKVVISRGRQVSYVVCGWEDEDYDVIELSDVEVQVDDEQADHAMIGLIARSVPKSLPGLRAFQVTEIPHPNVVEEFQKMMAEEALQAETKNDEPETEPAG